MAFAPKPKLGSKTVPKPPKSPAFIRGSRPPTLLAPHPKPLNPNRDYGKSTPSRMPMTGFGQTGMGDMPPLPKVPQ